jgi:putative ABC transport system permease protein
LNSLISHLRFVGRMAWRDSRASRRRLAMFALCIVVGVAALVAVGSFGDSLERAVEEQARSLLGADLTMGSRVRFSPEHEAFFESLGGEQAREIAFTTMIVFPERSGTRLVQVRALEGDFPFYGRIETQPPEAAERFRREGGVLVEDSVLMLFGAHPGDEVRIGQLRTRVAGSLQKVPGESVAFATIAPRVYLRMADLEATGLLQTGSLARYRAMFRLPEGTDVQALMARHRSRVNELRLNLTTVEERKEDMGRAMRNLYHYLNLVGFVALLLGGVSIASAIQVHVKLKVPTIAVLRCLGCPIWTAFAIYLLQGIALGCAGAIVGVAAGAFIQHALPRVAADFLPLEVAVETSWRGIGEAGLLGFVLCTLFSLLPLVAVRKVSPLEVLRVAYNPVRKRDPIQLIILILLMAVVVLFALAHTQRWQEGLGFAGGLIAAFGLLGLVARVAIFLARRLRLARWPFVIRQGLASVHRPNNRTLLLILSLGLGTFLLLTLQLTQSTLLHELVPDRDSSRANAILFDIQPDQREGVAALVRSQGLPVLDEAPIVTMRLKSIRDRPVESLLADRASKAPRWALRREFRCTYTTRLRPSETLVAGEWIGEVPPEAEPVPISMEDGIAEELGVNVGDALVWDIQGVPLRTQIASLREVDWRQVQPNFFVLFPKGPLDEAPAFHVIVSRVESSAQSARLQGTVVQEYPNVSVIDITVVLRTLDQVLDKVGFVIRFMALFTVATGLLVLVAAVLSGRYQRIRESILLRVLGASRRQVLRVLLVEYATLGFLAASTGVVLAFGAAAALAFFVFEVPFSPSPGPPVLAIGLVTALTMITGLLASRGVTTHPPLEILRSEGSIGG